MRIIESLLLKIFKQIPDKDWQIIEKSYIAYFRLLGCPLTNSTDGGEGFSPRGLELSVDEQAVAVFDVQNRR